MKLLTALFLTAMSAPAMALSVIERHATNIDIGFCSGYVSGASEEALGGTVDHTVNTSFDSDMQIMVSLFDAKFSDGTSKSGTVTLSGSPTECAVSIQENFTLKESCTRLAFQMKGEANPFGTGTLVRDGGTRFILKEMEGGCFVTKSQVLFFEKKGGI